MCWSWQAGAKYKIQFSFDIPGAGLYAQGPRGETTLRSALGEAIDYYVVVGKDVDSIISGYRQYLAYTQACSFKLRAKLDQVGQMEVPCRFSLCLG